MKKRKRRSAAPKSEVWTVRDPEQLFQDIGFSDREAARLALRCTLANGLIRRIRKAGWTQTEAAKRLGVSQPRISDLMCDRLERFSSDALYELLVKSGARVDVVAR